MQKLKPLMRSTIKEFCFWKFMVSNNTIEDQSYWWFFRRSTVQKINFWILQLGFSINGNWCHERRNERREDGKGIEEGIKEGREGGRWYDGAGLIFHWFTSCSKASKLSNWWTLSVLNYTHVDFFLYKQVPDLYHIPPRMEWKCPMIAWKCPIILGL